jgi:glycosyltransferase involved in cell wall biosynthesis
VASLLARLAGRGVVLFPSFTEESFGYVMVESLARGVVPISSDVCG